MTAQEAYAELISVRKNREDGYLTHLSYGGKADEQEEYTIKAYSVALNALEKQIPKKPQYVDTRFRHHGRGISDGSSLDKCYKCPNCNSHIFHVFDSEKCCIYCGQALDWSDNND